MKLHSGILTVLCIALFLIFLVILKQRSDKSTFDALVTTYIYAYPLVLMETTKNIMTKNGISINRFVHSAEFPTPTFKSIVRPNVDTLYSFAWLDLTNGPLILSLPNTHDRYYLIECMDAWTNVFASLGKRTTGTEARNFIIVGPFWQGSIPKDILKLQAPTNMVLLLGRTHTHGKGDYAQVHTIQSGYKLTPLENWLLNNHEHSSDIYLTNDMIAQQKVPVDEVTAMDAQTFFHHFMRLLKDNPPASEDALIVQQLKTINIEHENKKIVTSACKKALEKIEGHYLTLKNINGWGVILDIGTYGTDYLMRAMIAYLGIGANIPEDAVYPTAFVDADGNQLTGKNAYRIHFEKDQLPPVNAFWSLTLYNAESFLVQNPLHRYSLHDKDPLHFNSDGSLDIFIQHKNPGKEKEQNWLPAPQGLFNLTMRLYWPQQAVLNRTWNPPAIEQVN